MARNLKAWFDRLLDRMSEYMLPQLMSSTLAVLALYQGGAMAVTPGRYLADPAYSTVTAVAVPSVWGLAFALLGSFLLVGTLFDRAYVRGLSVALSGLHALVGLLTVYPIVAAEGLPTAFSSYMGSAVMCYFCYLMWRARLAKR